MKDRIRQLMEFQHMNQQAFASFIGIAPASLNSILTERTRPTLNTVEAIRGKMPHVNINWLMFGEGEMISEGNDQKVTQEPAAPMDLFSQSQHDTAVSQPEVKVQETVRRNVAPMDMKIIDKTPRKITEIRVFYDDQTWESFVPKK